MSSYVFTKSPCATDRLEQEIRASSITVALDYINTLSTQVTIVFKAALSEAEQTTLSSIVAAHTGQPLPQNYVQPVEVKASTEPPPFAQPTYRTKRDASDIVEIQPGTTGDIDFKIVQERYVQGGMIVIEGAQFGDYIEAAVEDVDGVILAPYRAALCEAWPDVVTYIVKEYVPVEDGTVTNHEINTYPLNAKITAGLYLCIRYHAVNTGSTRKVGVNYYLTKKL